MAACPHCQAVLPEPAPSICPNCGRPLSARSSGGGTPWERRDRIGFFSGLVETIKESLFQPAQFFQNMATSGGIGAPLFFGVLLGYLGQVVTGFYQLLVNLAFGSGMGSADMPEPLREALSYFEGIGGFIFVVLAAWFFVLIGLFVWAGLVHVGLLLIGGAREGFEATLRVSCYAQSTAIFNVIPLCGGLVTAVYSIVLHIIGLSEAHGISRGQAAAAVFFPIFLCCCCPLLLALVGGLMAGMIGAAS